MASIAASLFLVVTAWLRGLSRRQQGLVVALVLAVAALVAARIALSARLPAGGQALGDWLPCLLMLLVYWQAGRFSGAPNQRLQDWLLRFDRRSAGPLLDWWRRRAAGGWLAGCFELAYLFCYPLVPGGVAILYFAQRRDAIDPYWLLVTAASYLCYLVVPFAQTMPPRLVEGILPPPSAKEKIRSFNWLICRHASIHLNTFPSAHVAAALAASLALGLVVPVAGALFFILSLGIAAGAVLGRYHYLPDVILGALLAIAVRWVAG